MDLLKLYKNHLEYRENLCDEFMRVVTYSFEEGPELLNRVHRYAMDINELSLAFTEIDKKIFKVGQQLKERGIDVEIPFSYKLSQYGDTSKTRGLSGSQANFNKAQG